MEIVNGRRRLVGKELEQYKEDMKLWTTPEDKTEWVRDDYGEMVAKEMFCEDCGFEMEKILDASGKWLGRNGFRCVECRRMADKRDAEKNAQKMLGKDIKIRIDRLRERIIRKQSKFELIVKNHDAEMEYLTEEIERLKRSLG